ncbi:MAG: glycosyltransferase family 2 protein [Firmicutes bacterium]|nr:glycosyltransferase family 2 protein [Bacillota bacterium]
MNEEILLSIVIPVYNGEKYIEECLDSVLINRDKLNFEIVIVNDGSKDNSEKIILSYKKKYENIVYINNQNMGVSYSRNEGIKKSKGKYITFVDCDDILEKNWAYIIKKEIIEKNYEVVLFSQYFRRIGNECPKEKVLSYILTNNDENIRISGPYSKLFLRDFLIKNNIKFKTNLINGEDMLFCYESILAADNYYLIKDSFYNVRHNILSATRNFNKKIIESEIELLKEFNTIFLEKNSEIEAKNLYDFCVKNSIRTLLYRISYIDPYKSAKRIYKEVRNIDNYNNYLKEYKFKFKNIKNNLLIVLFKLRLYRLDYILLRRKQSKIKKDYFELL